MSFKKYFFSLPAFTCMLVVLALAAAAYTVWQQQNPAPSTTPVTDVSSNPSSHVDDNSPTNVVDASDEPSYTNDKRAVYYKGVLMPEADPKTFVAGDQWSELDLRVDAYDQNRFYKEGKIVFTRLISESDPENLIGLFEGTDGKVYLVKQGGIHGPHELQLEAEVDAASLRVTQSLTNVPSNNPQPVADEASLAVAYLTDKNHTYKYFESGSEGSSFASLEITK